MSKNEIKNIESAIQGDRQALEQLIIGIQDLVYNLALKMLLFPEDAKDATQEILIRVITHLSTFRAESTFATWVYRIATNYLLTIKGKQSGNFTMSFDDYALSIDTGQADPKRYAKNEGELLLLEEEVKISCTHGLLLCLTPMSRMVFILSEILEFNSQEGGVILDITPENFRKQRSRSKERIRNFLQQKCGLMDKNNPCRCKRKIDFLSDKELIDIKQLKFAQHTHRSITLLDQIDDLDKSTAMYRNTPEFKAPPELKEKINHLLNTF